MGDAHLTLGTVTWDYVANLHMPLKKRNTSSVQWKAEDLPSMPILVNKKKSQEHMRLVLHQQIPNRQSGEGRGCK